MPDEVVASPEPLIDVDEPVSPAPAAEEQKAPPAATDENAEAVETPEQQEAKKQSRNQRRFERQKTARIQAETEARMLRERITQLESQQRTQPEGEPQREQFEDYETYLRAVARYDAKQEAAGVVKTEREASQRRAEQDKHAEGDAKARQGWVEREKAFQKTTKDYDEIVMPYVEEELGRLSNVARRAIVDSDVGPNVLHYLAQNLDEHERIADLPPHKQAVEIDTLEAKMAAPVSKKASDAPPPVKPVGQGRSASSGFSENDSQAEYEAKRKAQNAKWAR